MLVLYCFMVCNYCTLADSLLLGDEYDLWFLIGQSGTKNDIMVTFFLLCVAHIHNFYPSSFETTFLFTKK